MEGFTSNFPTQNSGFGSKGEKNWSRSPSPIFRFSNRPSDGRQFHVIENHFLGIENPLTKEKKGIPLQYDASGSSIFVVGTGPDKKSMGAVCCPPALRV